MLKSYVRTAVQNLRKSWIYSGINVLGLAVSLTSCVLIVLYIKHELSFDTFFPDADRIYKLVVTRKYPSHSTNYSMVPHSWAKIIQQDFPEVEQTTRLFDPFLLGPRKQVIVTIKSSGHDLKTFDENFFDLADSSFLDFFAIQLLKGDRKNVLSRPDQVILSEATARRFFGSDDPIGKELGGDMGEFTVAGIFKDIPENSHMKIDLLGSLGGHRIRQQLDQDDFTWFMSHTYIKLKSGVDAKALEAKFPKMVDHYAGTQLAHELGQSWEHYKTTGNGYIYRLQPLSSIHLDPIHYEFTLTPGENSIFIQALAIIALLIVVIACINFINLATARSIERAKEVGVRKVIGASRRQLIIQFLTEAMLISTIAVVLATIGVFLLLPSFNNLVERRLHFALNVPVISGLIGLAFCVGMLAGFYPAIALSGFKPIVAIKGNFKTVIKGSWLRNALVLFQFTIAILLVAGTMIITQQMNFMRSKNLGFDKDQVLMVKRTSELGPQMETFLSEVRKMNGVQSAAATSSIVGNRDDVWWEKFNVQGSSEILTTLSMVFDESFADLIGLRLAEGRMFAKETNDSRNILLNEAAVKVLGLKSPIGKRLSRVIEGSDGKLTTTDFTIIGIVKDFHFQSLRDVISPLVIFNDKSRKSASNYVAIRLKGDAANREIGSIETLWHQLLPGRPFKYEFLDNFLNRLYEREELSRKTFTIFSALAIIIACVGVFGLSAYSAGKRIKEIGIRKVLGSSVFQIFILLSKHFTNLVVMAFLVAVPLSWVIMTNWLQNFAYRIDLGPGPFIVSGILAFSIALLTVSYHSIRAALKNPIEALRTE